MAEQPQQRALDLMNSRITTMQSEVVKAEDKLYEYETQYLQADYTNCGSVLRGFEGFLSSKDALRKRARPFKEEDRLFSLSSTSSPATRELERLAQLPPPVDPNMGGGKGVLYPVKV